VKEVGTRHFVARRSLGSCLNHLFQTAKTGAPAEYAETMSPVVLDQISGWILKQ